LVLAELAPSAGEDARARGLQMDVVIPPSPLNVRCDPVTLRSLLDLMVGALFKVAAAGAYKLDNQRHADGTVHLVLAGTPLNADLDAPDTAEDVRTGAGLRILVARRIAARVGGQVELERDGTLRVRLPAPPPAAT
jgi:hypothetical protein